MRKLLVIVTICVVIACLSLYIMDFRLPQDITLGQQEDSAEDERAGLYSAPDLAQPKTVLANVPEKTSEPSQPAPFLQQTEPAEDASASSTTPETPEMWTLVWSDEFDRPTLNIEYWTEVDRKNNYNGELQYYTPANSYVKDGILYLEARDEEKDGKRYTSGMVETANKLDFKYGRFEARMSLPVGKGLFPAFWLLAYKDNYEIDVLEMIGSEPHLVYGVNHFLKYDRLYKNVGQTTVDDPEAFHVYAMEWDKDSLKWYVDDELYYTAKRGVPKTEMYLILTLAVGGVWPGEPDKNTAFPNCLAVDYVRYYMPSEEAITGEER